MIRFFARRSRDGINDARRHLAKTKSQNDRVEQVAAESKKLSRENHFAQKFQQAMEGR